MAVTPQVRTTAADELTPEMFEGLAEDLGFGPFDLMVVSDGSGNTGEKPCGFYAASYWRSHGAVRDHWAGNSGGTNQVAELAPFLHVLWQFQNVYNGHLDREVRVACVSDSLVTVNCATRRAGEGAKPAAKAGRVYTRNANRSLWASLDWFEDNGYELEWRHVPRNSNPINARADREAGRVRAAFQELMA